MSTARDVMVSGVVSLAPEMSLLAAFRVLSEHKISGAPVVANDGKIVGVLSQTDLVREAFMGDRFAEFAPDSFYIGIPFFDGGDLQGIAGNLEEMTVEEAMNPNVVSVGPDDSVASLAAKMRNNKIHRLIVADDDKVVGVVTTFDLLKLLENQ